MFGFIAGLLIGSSMSKEPSQAMTWRNWATLLFALAIVIVVAYFTILLFGHIASGQESATATNPQHECTTQLDCARQDFGRLFTNLAWMAGAIVLGFCVLVLFLG